MLYISGCWDWREQAEKGSWYSIQARCGFLKLIVEVRKLTSRLTFFLIHDHGHLRVWLDMMFQVPCLPWEFVKNSWLSLFCMGHSKMTLIHHVWASNTEPNLLEVVSAGTTSMSWQRMGMKLTSVTWHWRNHMHQVHLKKRYACQLFSVETLEAQVHSFHSSSDSL